MSTRVTHLDKQRFGPWAVATRVVRHRPRVRRPPGGNGINVVFAARRLPILD